MKNVSPEKSTLNTPPRGSIKGNNSSAGAFNSPGSPSRAVTTAPKDESKRIAKLEKDLAAVSLLLDHEKQEGVKLKQEQQLLQKEVGTLKSQIIPKDNQIGLLKAQADEARQELEKLKNGKTSAETALKDREVEWSAELKKQEVAFIQKWNAREEELFAHIETKKALVAKYESELGKIKEEWKKSDEEWQKAADEGDQREAKLIVEIEGLEKEFNEYQKKSDLREKEWVGCSENWIAIKGELEGKIEELEVELDDSKVFRLDALRIRDERGDELRKAARDLARLGKELEASKRELEEVNAAMAKYQVYAEWATIVGLAYLAYTSPAIVSAGVDLLFHCMGMEATFAGLNESLLGYGMEFAAIGTGFALRKGLYVARAFSEKTIAPSLNKVNLFLLLLIVGICTYGYYNNTAKGAAA